MQEFINRFLENLNISQLISIGIMFWFFYRRLDGKIEKLDKKLSGKIEKLDERLSGKIDKLSEKVEDVDRRLCRLEGAFSSKECCMIKDSSQMRKAE
jgi:hypothetical protein